MIPAALVEALPDFSKKIAFGTPIWKIVLGMLALAIALSLLVLLQSWMGRRTPGSRLAATIHRALLPIAGMGLTWILYQFLQVELNTSGAFARLSGSALSVVTYLVLAWLSWLAVLTIFEWIISSPKISEQSLNANLLRLCARLVGFLGAVLVLALGAQSLGIPVLGVLAGLGFGGLALALARSEEHTSELQSP